MPSESPAPGPWKDPAQVSVLRSMALMAAGALLGLGLAGYALFTARGTSTLYVPPDAVALVNQQIVSRVDFMAQLQTLFGVDLAHASRTQRDKVLNDMIREELMVQRGKELDVASSDPDVRNAMVSAVEMEIAADAMTTNPPEARLREYYEAHKLDFSREGIMSVEDYVFPPGAEKPAADAVSLLRGGPARGGPADAASMAGLGGHRSGKIGDDEFYFAAKIHLGDRLFVVARDLPSGAVSEPVTDAAGIHVLRMTRNQPPVPVPFETAYAQVLTSFRRAAINRLSAGDEEFLTKRANILIADDMK